MFALDSTLLSARWPGLTIHLVVGPVGRDAELGMPRLILPSVQVNMRAGGFPPAESNGIRYLKLPIDAL